MELKPSGFDEPVIIDLTVQFVTSEHFVFEGIRKNGSYKLSELNVVQTNNLFTDSFQRIKRFGICRSEDLESFKYKIMNEMHNVLVSYRDGLIAMQEHLNSRLHHEVDASSVINWEQYKCTAASQSIQNVDPYDHGNELEWSSTQRVMKAQFVQIENLETGTIVYAKGLEGLDDSGLLVG